VDVYTEATGGVRDTVAGGFRRYVIVAGDDHLKVRGPQRGEVVERPLDGRTAIAGEDTERQACILKAPDERLGVRVGLRSLGGLELQFVESRGGAGALLSRRQAGDVLENGRSGRAGEIAADTIEVERAWRGERVVEVEQNGSYAKCSGNAVDDAVPPDRDRSAAGALSRAGGALALPIISDGARGSRPSEVARG
jgi:hypothetical protein